MEFIDTPFFDLVIDLENSLYGYLFVGNGKDPVLRVTYYKLPKNLTYLNTAICEAITEDSSVLDEYLTS